MWIGCTGIHISNALSCERLETYPSALSETVKSELVSDFSRVHGILTQVSSVFHMSKGHLHVQANLACWRKPAAEHP